MRFGPLCGALLLSLLPTWGIQAQTHTSQIIVTGRSLAVEPATNNDAALGGVTTFLTTFDGSSGRVLTPFSGEAKPQYLGSSNYVTDYEGRLGIMNPSGTLVNYGELVISNMPVTVDSDGDGLPDFLEKNLASSFSVDAADREDYRFDGNTNNSEWTLSFLRSADSHAGTYTLRKKTDPYIPEKIWNGNFQLKGGTGTATFDTNNKTLSVYTESFDTVYSETNTATCSYGVTQNGKLLASGFWLNSSFGSTRQIYINPFLVQRIGTADRGRSVLYSSDGHAYDLEDPNYSTPYPDYTEFHLEVTNFPAFLTQTPTAPSSLPWNDDFSTTTSSNNYLDFRYSHFARLDIFGGKLNLVSSDHLYGENYGNLSIYSPPYLLLPLDASWDLSVQVALPAPDGAYYKGVGVSLAPENDTYDIANFGATVYSFELGQDDDPATPGTFLATYARKDWVEDPSLGLVTSVNFNTAFLRFSYNSATKVLSTFYDASSSSPTRSWTPYDELNLNPADPTSVAADLGLTSSSKIRMALWADAYVSSAVHSGHIWMDSLSIQSAPFPPPPLTNGLRANLGQAFSYNPAWSNSPTSFTAANLPAGLSNNPTTGAITGSPTVAGYYRVTQTASNAYGTTLFTIPITIPGSPQTFPFADIFTNTVPNRYMPLYNLAAPSQLVISNGSLRFISIQSDSDGSLAAWIPNLPLPLTNSWDVVVDAKMPSGWDTPYAGVGLTLMPYEETGTIESTGMQRRLNLKLGRDTEDPIYAGNYFARAAYTNNEEYVFPPPGASLPFVTSNTPATQATLRYSFHAPTKTLSTWYRTNGANSWQQLGTPYDLNPSAAGSLGHAWGLSNSSTLRVALWGDSNATNGSAGQAIELDNFSASIPTGLIYPSLPPTLTRRPGQPVFLSASPRDVGTYTYTWKKGSPTQPDLPFMPGFTNHLATYYFGNPSSSDSGTYYLIVMRDGLSYGTNSTIITFATNAPAGPRSDDFSGDLGRWNGVWGFDAHDTYLKVASGKLQVVSDKAGSENTQSFYFWDRLLPSDQSWELSVEAYLDTTISPPLAELYFYHSLRLNAEIPVSLSDLSAGSIGLGINFAEDKDGLGNRRRAIQNVLAITNDPGWVEVPSNALLLSQNSVGLRLRYESSTKVLSSYFRTNLSSTNWQLAASTNFSSLPPAQLQNGFSVHIGNIAEPSFVIQEGQAYFDNFTLKYDLSVSNAAVVTKSFDGSRSATITGTLVGVVAGDSVDHDGAGLFDTPAPGVNKPVTANLTLTGTESAHYTITQPTGLTGTIQSLSEIFFGNLDPTTVASDGLTYLMKYAYGAADPTSPISHTLRPVTTLTTNTNGQPALALTYYARTNDTNLSILPVWNTNLSAPVVGWESNVTVITLGTNSTNGLVLERRQATVPIDSNSKKFLRLKTTLEQ